MISRENYLSQYEKIPFQNLSSKFYEGHEFVLKVTENANNWDLYYESETIRNTVDEYLRALNRALIDAKNPEDSRKVESKVVKTTTTTKPNSKAKPTASTKKVQPTKCPPKTQNKRAKPAAKIVELVRDLEVEIRLMNRFKNLHLKPKSYQQVLGVLNAINRAVEKGQIRKKVNPTKYHQEIEWMQSKLLKALTTAYSGHNPKEIQTLEFDPKRIEQFKKIWSSYQVYPSVRYGLRFIAMEGKAPDIEKARKLYNEIKQILKMGRIEDNDPNAKHLPQIADSLEDYLREKSEIVQAQAATLSGLAGVVLGCGCQAEKKKPHALNGLDQTFDIIYTDYPESSNLPYFPESSSNSIIGTNMSQSDIIPPPKGKRLSYQANNLPSQNEDALAFSGRWKELFGNPIKGFSAMIYGPPKSGKSTLSVDLGGYLAQNFGNVLYASIEEGARGTITERIRRLSAGHPRMTVKNYLPSDLGNYQFVIVDSVSRGEMDIHAMRQLIHQNPRISFIFIFHVTKGGLPRGTSEFQHEVDVLVEVNEGQASAIGRFGPGETQVRFN